MEKRQLGKTGPVIYPIGLGCMGMSGVYGQADVADSVATILDAIDAGVTFIDTADFYGMGDNETLLRQAFHGRGRKNIVLSLKFGAMRDPSNKMIGIDARPNSVKNFLAYSLRRLHTDYVDVYRPARVDPTVPIEDTVGAIADMVKAGYVRYIGLSEAGSETIRRANAVHPIVDLQIEYSIFSRGIEASILPTCRELGIAITAYGILSRGLLGGRWTKDRAATPDDFRNHAPRFNGKNLEHNLALVKALNSIAKEHGATVSQLAIAWVLSRGGDIFPILGARKPAQLQDALGALKVELNSEDIARIEKTVPPGSVAGDRYAAPQMAHLDSEKG